MHSHTVSAGVMSCARTLTSDHAHYTVSAGVMSCARTLTSDHVHHA